jgi:hypothetical protein
MHKPSKFLLIINNKKYGAWLTNPVSMQKAYRSLKLAFNNYTVKLKNIAD